MDHLDGAAHEPFAYIKATLEAIAAGHLARGKNVDGNTWYSGVAELNGYWILYDDLEDEVYVLAVLWPGADYRDYLNYEDL